MSLLFLGWRIPENPTSGASLPQLCHTLRCATNGLKDKPLDAKLPQFGSESGAKLLI